MLSFPERMSALHNMYVRTECASVSRRVQALRAGNMKTVRLKIEKLSEEERGWVDYNGRTFLHYVVMENKPKLVPVVNVLTAQAHIADHFSLTPRALAVVSGYDECASMLEVLEGPLVSAMNNVRIASSLFARVLCSMRWQHWHRHVQRSSAGRIVLCARSFCTRSTSAKRVDVRIAVRVHRAAVLYSSLHALTRPS